MAGSRDVGDNYKVDIQFAPLISGGDELRNINCYEYLLYLFGKINKSSEFTAISGLNEFFAQYPDYNGAIAYGDLYTVFLEVLEYELDKLSSNPADYEIAIKNNAEVIEAIYKNSNRGLERAADMIASVTTSVRHTSSQSAKKVRNRLTASADTQVNQITPQQIGSLFGRASVFINMVFRGVFKPQLSTSMASIRRYDYTKAIPSLPTELRFGTQGEFHEGKARVSPLFEAWLRVIYANDRQASVFSSAAAASAAQGINATRATLISPSLTESQIQQGEEVSLRPYVYFNNLGLDRDNLEGKMERELTLALHSIESRHPHVVVITLPADKGLLELSMLNKHQKEMTYDEAFNRMLNVALGKSDEKIKDFSISSKVRKTLFGEDADNEKSRFESLLLNSFNKLGFGPGDKLTPAEFHAVYFHFIKFELTNYILTKLKPLAFNMSCKDAIDRGGVSSAYYNLLKSIEVGSPMQKHEFLRALHAAPALVKGRGINHHAKAIWNALNQYVQYADKASLPDWLPGWVNENRLIGTRQDFIQKLEEYIQTRRVETSLMKSFISMFSTHGASEKISAASNLLLLLKGERVEFNPDPKELGALNNGRLGALVDEMRNYGVLSSDQFKPAPEPPHPIGPINY